MSSFADANLGAEARFKRANDTNELNGIKIQFVEFADDNSDPATATSQIRRLVTQLKVFAVVPDLSAVNPGAYLAAEHVPYLGMAFDDTYCNASPSTTVWGFGFDGCLIANHPSMVGDGFAGVYKYVNTKTAKQRPSYVIFSSDTQSGKGAAQASASAAEGAGFNVVSAKGSVPSVTSDYSPYVQQWLRADGGRQPDAIDCRLTVQCVPIWQALKAAGFNGIFVTALGAVDALAKPLAGTITLATYNPDPSAGLTQLEADLNALKPGTKPVSYANVPAYFAADMFIQAVKKVGRNITPEAVQQALADQMWQIPGFVGPIKYPASTVLSTPTCAAIVQYNPDGSGFSTLEPYTCSDRQFNVDPKFSG
jgi:ABC-type branched-subunit amino acid transport system substrate-binding protein